MGRQPKEEERKRKPVNKKWTIDQKWAGLGTIKYGENNHLNVQPDGHFHLKWDFISMDSMEWWISYVVLTPG